MTRHDRIGLRPIELPIDPGLGLEIDAADAVISSA
jgi:hypothetical protein